MAEDAAERFKQVLAQSPTGFHGQFDVARHVDDAMGRGDLRVQKVAHEVVLG